MIIDTNNLKDLQQKINQLNLSEIQSILSFFDWNVEPLKAQLIERGFILQIFHNLDWKNENKIKLFLENELRNAVRKASQDTGKSQTPLVIIELLDKLEKGTLFRQLQQLKSK